MKRNHIFVAEDGATFETAAECKEHEAWASIGNLVNLTENDILAALNRSNMPLANALERAGAIIAAKRRESGELKRARKLRAAPPMPDAA